MNHQTLKGPLPRVAACLLQWLLLCATTLAQTWFPPSTTAIAQLLKDVGCQHVRSRGNAVGGLLVGANPGPVVVFSSNDPVAAIKVLGDLGSPVQGKVLSVFGSEVKLQQGDYLLKLDFTDTLRNNEVALPLSGPSIDSFELVIGKGTSMPVLAVASDLVICLQNRAHTANEFVQIQLEHYRPLPDGQLALDLSLRVFDPALRDRAAEALVEVAAERVGLHGATLLRWDREAAPDSGRFPKIREALGPSINVLQESPARTSLFLEDFGRPEMPALTLRVGSQEPADIQALARVLALILALDNEPEGP